jgi:hypothetical protein
VSGSKLTRLQRRILTALAGISPAWTLTGGGALAGVHLGHRLTRDLDLFWRNRRELGDLLRTTEAALSAAGLEPRLLQTAPAFAQLRVADDRDVCMVDLVAEPFGPIEVPVRVEIDGVGIAVDTRHEILASKLATLLERSELRDLIDVKVLLEAGEDFTSALRDAPAKDAGFSALTLAWVLKDFDVRLGARTLEIGDREAADLVEFRDQLIERLTAASAPE